MKSSYFRGLALLFVVSIIAQAGMAADQFINCRKFDKSIKITIDGDPKDWPIKDYGDSAELPDVPEGENYLDTSTSNAIDQVPMKTGDHFVWNAKKVLFNGPQDGAAQIAFEAIPVGDYAATTYVGWDDTGMFVLNVVKDNSIGWDMGQGSRDTGNAPAYTNDGIELWFDNNYDRLPENINTDTTSETDLQLDISIDDAVTKEEFSEVLVQSNGNPLEINMFRTALDTNDDAENAILAKIIHVAKLDDKGVGKHTSYVQEIFLPWGVFPEFQAHTMGFNLNWVNWDFTTFILMRWGQINESELMYFRELRFTSDKPLGAPVSVSDWSLF